MDKAKIKKVRELSQDREKYDKALEILKNKNVEVVLLDTNAGVNYYDEDLGLDLRPYKQQIKETLEKQIAFIDKQLEEL